MNTFTAMQHGEEPRRQPHLKSDNFQSCFRPRQENNSSESNSLLLYHVETPIISALGQSLQTPSVLQPIQNSGQTCIDSSSAPNWNVHKFSQREIQTWTLSNESSLIMRFSYVINVHSLTLRISSRVLMNTFLQIQPARIW